MSVAVDFDFDDVLPTVRAAAPGASTEEAEDAIQTAVVEHLRKGTPLTAPNVVQRAKSRLIDARKKRDNRHASLDAFREKDEDHAGFEFAVVEVDFDSHMALAEPRPSAPPRSSPRAARRTTHPPIATSRSPRSGACARSRA